jgi:transposase, IS5 family
VIACQVLGVMGVKQLGFGDYEQATAKKRTRRERSLAEMEKVVPWKALIDLIDPHYPKTSSKGGRPPYPLATMLRIHLLQQWYDLSDPAMEDALIEVPTMRRFAGIEPGPIQSISLASSSAAASPSPGAP